MRTSEERETVLEAGRAIVAALRRRLPTKVDFVEEAVRLVLGEESICCGACNSTHCERSSGESMLRCLDCGNRSCIFDGTVFYKAKKIDATVMAVYLVASGLPVNSLDLHHLVGLCYSSSHYTFMKLMMLMHKSMENTGSLLPSAQFLEAVGKRSRVTPVGTSPAAEEAAMIAKDRAQRRAQSACADNGQKSETSQSQSQTAGTGVDLPDSGGQAANARSLNPAPKRVESMMEANDKAVLALLSQRPGTADEICTELSLSPASVLASLSILELCALVEAVGGGRFAAKTKTETIQIAVTKRMKEEAERFVEHVQERFHRISRKYLQNYLAAYWFFVDRRRWVEPISIMLNAERKNISLQEILAYVTPLTVRLCAAI